MTNEMKIVHLSIIFIMALHVLCTKKSFRKFVEWPVKNCYKIEKRD